MKRFGSHGFSLIEMMIVVVIIAILVGIAYPSYRDQVNKTRRSDAKTALTNAAALEERHFTENNTYKVDNMTGLGGNTSPEGYYGIAVSNPGTAGCGTGPYYCYALTATLQASLRSSDPKCKTLSIDHTGNKTSTDSGDNDSTANGGCW